MSKYSSTKFFYARKDGDESVAFPVESIRSIHMTAATTLMIQFESLTGAATHTGNVSLTITEGKSEEVIKSIINAGRSDRNLFIVIADDIDGEYVNSNITAVVDPAE